MYTARPDPLVRNFPPELDAVEITVPVPEPEADDAAAGDPVDELAALLLALLPLLHAAASSATPTAAESRASTGVRRNNESLIDASPVCTRASELITEPPSPRL